MKSKIWIIYALLDEVGIPIYVGSTFDIERRLKEHKQERGFTGSYSILRTGTGDRRKSERWWIAHYFDLGYPLQNKIIGAGGSTGQSEDSRLKLSLAIRGRPKPEGFGEKVSAAQKGQRRNWSPEGRKRIRFSQFKKGHKHSELNKRNSFAGRQNFFASKTPEELKEWYAWRADRKRVALARKRIP